MNEIYNLLKLNEIKLSLAVYPWPNTLIYDSSKSKYVEIWRNFCVNKCSNYIDLFPLFFENQKKIELDDAKKLIKKYYLENDMHFNKTGNKIISNLLTKIYK